MATSDARQIVPPPTPMKITQIAVVVRDMEAALKSYTETMGWGPWSVFDYKPPLLHDTVVRGEQVEYRMIGAETSVDGLGFELIQPVSGPSIYQEFLDSHGEGVQHIACMKHSAQDSQALKDHWRERGGGSLMGGGGGGAGRWVRRSGSGRIASRRARPAARTSTSTRAGAPSRPVSGMRSGTPGRPVATSRRSPPRACARASCSTTGRGVRSGPARTWTA